MAAISTLVDSFTVDDQATLWSNSGHTVIGGGTAVVTCLNTDALFADRLASTNTYSLTGSALYAKVASTNSSGNTSWSFGVTQAVADEVNDAYLSVYEGTLYGVLRQASVQTASAGVTYDPVAHAWMRLREAGGTLFYDASPDGLTWTQIWSTTYTLSLSALFARVTGGWPLSSGTYTLTVTNFNVPPATPSQPQVYAPGWHPGQGLPGLPGGIPFYAVQSETVPAAVTFTGTADLAAAGAVTAAATQIAGASLAGAGTVTGAGAQGATATVAGATAVTAVATQGAGAAAAATGTVTAKATEAATANLAGAGALTAVAAQGATATVAAAGNVVAGIPLGFTSVPGLAVPGLFTPGSPGAPAAAGPATGAASLAGAAAVSAAAVQAAGANLAGAGAVAAVAAQAATAAPTGAAAVTATATQAAAASPAGAGAVTAKATQTATATIAGAAAVTAAATQAVTATATGAGSVTAAATQIAGASLTAAGTVTAAAAQAATAPVAAAGTVTAVVTEAATAAPTGAGAVTAVAAQVVTASLAGAGSVAAAGSGIPAGFTSVPGLAVPGLFTPGSPGAPAAGGGATASLAGAGAVTATATQAPAASPAGAGAVAAVAAQIAGTTLAGAGTVTAKATQAATASVAGAGTVAAVATQRGTAALTAAGTVNASGVITGTATLAGASALTALTRQAAGSALAAAGAVTAGAGLRSSASLAAAGSVTAAGSVQVAFTIGALTASTAPSGLLTAGTVPGAAHAMLGLVSENTAMTRTQSWAADVATLGITPVWQSLYYTTGAAFPVAETTAAAPAPRMLMISWAGWPDSEVSAGIRDAVITARAQALAAIGRPVILRWDFEMNITAWGYEATGAAANGPAFITAWRRVRDLFRAAGASNVAFAWTPNASSAFDPQSWRPYYPGDAYVDWVGVDGYNFGNSNFGGPTTWQTAYQIFHAFTDDWRANFGGLTAGKPLLAGETGCYEGGGSKSWWLTDLSGFLHGAGASGVTLFNSNQSGSGINWRWDSDAAATVAATEIANDPWYGGTSAALGSGYPAAVLATGPFAYWQFGELAGNFADSSGSGFTAAAAGTTGTTTRGCVLKWPGAGYGLSFYSFGRADLTALGNFGSSMTAGFTVSFAYKDGNSGTAATILGQLNTGTTTGLMILANTNHSLATAAGLTTFWFRNEAGTAHWAEITGGLYDGLWHHVTWVCNPGGTDVVYVDGVSQTLTSAQNGAPGTTVNFGFSPFLGARDNRGAIDQPCIGVAAHLGLWKAKLTPAQVTGLYSALTAAVPVAAGPGSAMTASTAPSSTITTGTAPTGGPS